MITVTAVVQKKRNLYQVLFSNGQEVVVSEDLIVSYRLLKGKELEEEIFKDMLEAVKSDFAFQQSLNYIDIKMRTTQEVVRYLKEKDYDEKTIATVIDRLLELEVLDDQFYAESFMRTKMREGNMGPYLVVQKLIQKGIDASIAEASISEYTDEYLLKNSLHLAEKLKNRYRNKTIKEQKNKIYQSMIQKGFSKDWTQQALEQLSFEQSEAEEYALLYKQGLKYLKKYKNKPWWEQKQKIKAALYQKGFDLSLIQKFLEEEAASEYRN